MNCGEFVVSDTFVTLVPEYIQNGMRVISYKQMHFNEWQKIAQTVTVHRTRADNVRDGWNEEEFTGFYGYSFLSGGLITTYSTFWLYSYIDYSKVNYLVLVVRNIENDSACVYKIFTPNAWDTDLKSPRVR